MDLSFLEDYPWVKAPLIVCAPMMKITLARAAVATSRAGGFGFLAAGFDLSTLDGNLEAAAKLLQDEHIPSRDGVLPLGVGFQNWGSDIKLGLAALEKYPPAAAWFFAPKQLADLITWSKEVRKVTRNRTKIWIQVGTVAEAIEVAQTSKPDVIVLQGSDAGGHGLKHSAGLISLVPEAYDALLDKGLHTPLVAAGGISDGRGIAAVLMLGASGVAMGTRFLASEEVQISKGYQDDILKHHDGGSSTVKSVLYDTVREIHGWPFAYDARGIANRTYFDALDGMPDDENTALYKEAMKQGDDGWGPGGRMTTYAGTGVGLIKDVDSAGNIVKRAQREALIVLEKASQYHLQYSGHGSTKT